MFLLILSLKWLAQKDFWTEAIWTSAWPDKCAISVIPAGSTTHSSHTLGTPTLCSSQFATGTVRGTLAVTPQAFSFNFNPLLSPHRGLALIHKEVSWHLRLSFSCKGEVSAFLAAIASQPNLQKSLDLWLSWCKGWFLTSWHLLNQHVFYLHLLKTWLGEAAWTFARSKITWWFRERINNRHIS